MVEPIEEDEEEEDEEADMGEGSSTEDLAPRQVLAPWAIMPAAPGFWVVSPSDQVARRGQAASLRSRVKAVQMESTAPAKTEKEVVCQLQVEELAVEEVCQGKDVATLEVVMEAAGVLICSQLEGLGVLTRQVAAPP